METRYAVLRKDENGKIFPIGIAETHHSALGLALAEIDNETQKAYGNYAAVSGMLHRDDALDTIEIAFTVKKPKQAAIDEPANQTIVIFRAED